MINAGSVKFVNVSADIGDIICALDIASSEAASPLANQ